MQSKAFILFCCLLVYVLELVAIPVFVLPASLHQVDQPDVPPVCSKMPVKGCGAGQQDACCETTCCSNCPLGFVTTVEPVATPAEPSITTVRTYRVSYQDYWFLFLSESWKPPDGLRIAMKNKDQLLT